MYPFRIAIILLLPTMAMAQEYVPADCVELAIREGFPSDILTVEQVKAAKKRLQWLRVRHPFDPLVQQCHAAIKAARAVNK